MKVLLKNVDINVLRSLLDRSLVVTNQLAFEISSSIIKSSIANEEENFWKEWSMPTKGIFESEIFESINVLFSNGMYFKSKFLGLFGNQRVDIEITHNSKREAEMFEITGKTSFGATLRVNMKTTRYDMAHAPMETAIHDKLFNKGNSITTFDISPTIISEINKLRGLNTMADAPVSYVTFSGKDGVLKVFDSSFEFEVSEYTGTPFEAKFPKKSLSLIDHENHTISYCKSSDLEFDWFLFTSNNAVVTSQSVALLMTQISNDSNIDDTMFNDNSGWGME